MCLNVDVSIFSTFLNVWAKWDLSLTFTGTSIVVASCSTGVGSTLNPVCSHCSTTCFSVKNIKISPVSPKLKVHFDVLCSVTNEKYLQVAPNIVWLSPDMIGGEFDIYSNVVWRID